MRPVMVRTSPQLATAATRAVAWLVDLLILGAIAFAWALVATAAGVITVDPDARSQILASPFSPTSAPPYRADIQLVAVFAAILFVAYVVFAAFCWMRFRGLPGQRALSLEVADAATGKNLSLMRALSRSLVGIGLPGVLVAVSAVALMSLASSPSWTGLVNQEPNADASRLVNICDISWLLTAGWLLILLVTTVSNARRQGLHDRAAKSVVVKRGHLVAMWPVPGMSYGPYPSGAMPPGQGSPTGTDGYPAPTGLAPWAPPSPSPAPGWPVATAAPPESPPAEQPTPDDTPPADTDGSPAWLPLPADSDLPPAPVSVTVRRRTAAYLIDGAMLAALFVITESIAVSIIDPAAITNATSGGPISDRTVVLVGLLSGLEQMAYFTASWALGGASFGQRILRLQVTCADTSKGLSWMDSFLRWAILQGPIALALILPQTVQSVGVFAAVLWGMFLVWKINSDPTWLPPHDRFVNSRVSGKP